MFNLLVLCYPNMHDMEFTNPVMICQFTNQITPVLYATKKQDVICQGKIVQLAKERLQTEVDLEKFDGIFIPGGMGAKELRKDAKAIETIRYFYEAKKSIFAICDAPNVLYENKLIAENQTYCSFPIPNIIAGKNRTNNKVEVSNNLITAIGCGAAIDLGVAMVKFICNNDPEINKLVQIRMFGS